MKSNHDFRSRNSDSGSEDLRKPAKLDPVKKSGKEKRSFYNTLDDDDDDDLILSTTKKRESILDYFDDGNDDPYDEEEYEEDMDDMDIENHMRR